MLLKDRIALITGSGRGIGRAIAQLFATEGAAVFLTARTEKELSATAEEITQGGGRAAFVTGDLAKEADCRAVFEKAIASFGRVDILVNNGGHYGPVVPVEEYPMEEFDRVLAVHLRANAICPGPVTETEMSKDLGAELARKLNIDKDEQLAGFLESILQGRGQTAKEIAEAALFLCSEKASAITGQAINVDGGAVFY